MPKALKRRSPKEERLKELATNQPDLNRLREEFDWSVQQRDANVWRRQQLNYEARYAIWPGQSWDGRKWVPDSEGNIWPWPGASDARVLLVDKYINEDVARLMTVWRRMQIGVTGNEAQDLEWGGQMTNYLRWQFYRKMKEARFEAKLLANYFKERGAAVMGTFWARERQLEYVEIDLEQITAGAMQAQQVMGTPMEGPNSALIAQMPQLIMNPAREEEAVQAALTLGYELTEARLARVIRDLRETGTAKFPQPYVKKNRPVLRAYAVNEDLFLPPEATFDLEIAPAIDTVELLTETQLREKITGEGWDKKWVEKVLETQRGKVSDLHYSSHVRRSQRLQGLTEINPAKLYEVIRAYRRRSDEEGVPGIYYTAYSRGLTDQCGYHELLNYQHGDYPFTLFLREVRSRRVDDARGVGEVLHTLQNHIKTDWDRRADRADIATLPPSFHPPGMAPSRWGPGVQVPVTTGRKDEYGFFDPPAKDSGSKEMSEDVRRFADEYMGRPVDEQNMTQSQAIQQEEADDWMSGWTGVGTQVMQLCQQFEDDEIFFNVVGSEKGRGIRTTREGIQGEFDLVMAFNVGNLDNKLVTEKLGLIQESLALDQEGVIDRRESIQVAFEMIDPSLAQRLIRSGADSMKAIRDEVQKNLVLMYQGNDAEYVESDPTAQMKLQVLNAMLFGDGIQTSGNPKYQKALQEDEQFLELVKNYEKNLKQSVVQMGQNVVAGRQGVKPVNRAGG